MTAITLTDQLQCVDIWIGNLFEKSSSRVLVLGESAYDFDGSAPMSEYVPLWTNGEVGEDPTFRRILNAATGLTTEHTKKLNAGERIAWWNTIAFYNLAIESLGPNNTCKAKPRDFKHGLPQLELVLEVLQPQCVSCFVILGWLLQTAMKTRSVSAIWPGAITDGPINEDTLHIC